jgi:hypothetical protein
MDRPEVACKDPALETRHKREKEEHAGGEYDINISKYFKLMLLNIDQSIFED